MSKVYSVIIEGLDGSGKGTYALNLSKELSDYGFNVIIVEYPQYKTNIGLKIRDLLHIVDSEKSLNIKERMALYSLNRIESIEYVKQKINELSRDYEDKPIYIIYDRSHFSNAVTCAYYFHKHNITSGFKKYYKFIFNIDSVFIKELKLENTPVYIPFIDPRISLESLRKDNTREKVDHYEDFAIQTIANENYLFISRESKNVHLINQINDFGNRYSPHEIVKKIFDDLISNKSIEKNKSSKKKGVVYTLVVQHNKPIQSSLYYKEMKDLVKKYKLNALKSLLE